ncbi:DedA family protein [Pilimelia columellifera]|uniref:VTT domain-containing protein n=1 Tax=Pilimelia columellifera subsp. columellifera TaxID=706583 RepID=A0ABP6ASJ0_9ACTN
MSPWVYVGIAASIAGSAVFPPLPSEGALVAAMGLAAARELDLGWVCLTVAVGATLGDLAAYSLGRAIGAGARQRRRSRVRRGLPPGPGRRQVALGWLRRQERSWGPGLVVTGRFIPGGTAAVGISAGLLRYPVRRYLPLSCVGAVLWTGYGAAVGFLGHAVLPGNVWAAVALAVALAVTVGVALSLRRSRPRRRP